MAIRSQGSRPDREADGERTGEGGDVGVIQGFERRLQGAVGNTFARLFGGSVQPDEVANALQEEAGLHLQHQGHATVAPNRFTVRLGPADHRTLGSDIRQVEAAFSAMLNDYVDQQGWQTFGAVAVTLEESDVLHTGQFRVNSSIDPDVGRRPSKPSAGVGPMSQPPVSQPPRRSGPAAARAGPVIGQRPLRRPAGRSRRPLTATPGGPARLPAVWPAGSNLRRVAIHRRRAGIPGGTRERQPGSRPDGRQPLWPARLSRSPT